MIGFSQESAAADRLAGSKEKERKSGRIKTGRQGWRIKGWARVSKMRRRGFPMIV